AQVGVVHAAWPRVVPPAEGWSGMPTAGARRMPPLGQSAQALPQASGRLFRGSPLAARPPKERAASIPAPAFRLYESAGARMPTLFREVFSPGRNQAGRARNGVPPERARSGGCRDQNWLSRRMWMLTE